MSGKRLSRNQITSTMRRYVDECRDPATNEVNHTLLAEKTADELNAYTGDDFEIPEQFFEIAATFS